MTSPPNKGNGRGINFLRSLVGHQGDDCIIWPMTRSRGYGTVGLNGKLHKAHRIMCELERGPAPTPSHEAAHLCGNGHLGCVNPKHLRWKTRVGNQADRYVHATVAKKDWGRRGKLKYSQAVAIREAAGRETVTDLAKRFAVDRSTIRQIQAGKIWTRLRSPEQDHVVNTITKAGGALRYTQIALAAGIKESSVSTLLRKLIRDGGLVKRGLGVYATPPSAFT